MRWTASWDAIFHTIEFRIVISQFLASTKPLQQSVLYKMEP